MQTLKFIQRLSTRMLLVAILVVPFLAGISGPAFAAEDTPGTVYTITNAASGNQVLAFDRTASGVLSLQAYYPTGGLGSGAGLGSASALALSQGNQWLFAVNAGSNTVSVFSVGSAGLQLASVSPSGGVQPISLTTYGNLLYVLNAGGSGNITGFTIANDGSLSPLPGSTQPLSSAAAGPAQISFTPDGTLLVVTEKATGIIDTYQVVNGLAMSPVSHASSGITPFGFAFSGRTSLIVSEAFGGAPGQSAVSSYHVDGAEFQVVSPSVGTTQTSACWIAVSKNGKYAYSTNAASGSISSYQVSADGSLTLMNATAGLTGAGSSPIDMAFSNNSAYLYALNSGTHTIRSFQVQADGSLVFLADTWVPAGSVGLAAR